MRVPLVWLKDYVELPKDLSLLTDKLTMAGHLLDKVEHQKENTIIDLELRGNRADCYSIYGIAREVSALFDTPVKTFSIHPPLRKVESLPECKIEIKTPLVKRFMATIIHNVKIKPSPEWMKVKLEQYGIPPINNIVDTTNFVMIETGEPMHAFDLDLVGKKMDLRLAKKGESFTTFEGTLIKLTEEDLIFVNKKPMGLTGAIGAKDFSIQNNTKNVLFEAANYDRVNIRRTIRRHNLNTDAGLRHEKELDLNNVSIAFYRFLQIIKENDWGEIEPEIFDYYPNPVKERTIAFDLARIKVIGGVEIEKKSVLEILNRLNFRIKKNSGDELSIICPTYRTDVVQEEDLVEEVLRIYGYENIPPKILSLEIPSVITPNFVNQELNLKNKLIGLGFDEIISSAFVKPFYQKWNCLIEESEVGRPVLITNPPSPEIETMRMSLYPNLLEFTHRSISERVEETRFFEIGKIYFRRAGRYFEKRKLGIAFWKKTNSEFKDFKGFLETLLGTDFPVQSFKLTEDYIYYLEVDLDKIINGIVQPKVYLWPKYPPIIEDLSFTIPQNIKFQKIIQLIESTNKIIQSIKLIDSYENSKTFRITYQNPKKTLTDKDVKKVREEIINHLKIKLGIKLKE
ncbi:hypothetical protein COT44_02270 [Candidatus Shapirobacteria bacterium CG08_land_8_20_14_0_20_39_18]|uniref:Phenylalanine--tRNA ligase beta subunit n=1 Tax=Candidatus Shapirobacteria bacterium CG08_land_8_20_14_0_20_39_18 TaxID=1974883 RepID=A0A2M6XD50_9BACT|nr:MAG: hypothetical protein COT44_02270 [Candidatus Shapirobacteria bacterium CG08_land_8_20_14_0_20_39_18]PIY66136.1 MAG: hypothetical protein COY91_01540 [Candidatus Shapirobacteria bacterium CG_4_10_14_0_8_um_filter_39_15]PJE68837.1 MAG: hypothetical protein COU94_00010 [Candidatus Shapirobacteria bacterium CG10_big_fil_rev_8_21_14_0_10_38_8]